MKKLAKLLVACGAVALLSKFLHWLYELYEVSLFLKELEVDLPEDEPDPEHEVQDEAAYSSADELLKALRDSGMPEFNAVGLIKADNAFTRSLLGSEELILELIGRSDVTKKEAQALSTAYYNGLSAKRMLNNQNYLHHSGKMAAKYLAAYGRDNHTRSDSGWNVTAHSGEDDPFNFLGQVDDEEQASNY